MPTRHPLIKLLALSESLPADALSHEQKQQRDRQIAVAADAHTPSRQVDAWLEDQASTSTLNNAEHWLFSWQLVQLTLWVIGLLLGAGICGVALRYTGAEPINILSAWVVLVGLPFLLMILWLLTLLPFKLPVVALLSSVIQRAIFLPFGQWLMRHLNKAQTSTASHTPRLTASRSLLFSMSSMLMQWFAFGVGLGSLFTALYLLASSDLAFAWSTSFAVEAPRLHAITSVIATPFSAIVSSTEPSLELIQNSHYFRLKAAADHQFSSQNMADQLTHWWPFLIASIIFYAVVPRIATVFISHARFKQSVISDMHALPDYPGLIARMSSPLVSTIHSNSTTTASIDRPTTMPKSVPLSLTAPMVNWGQIDIPDETLEQALANMSLGMDMLLQAGGQNTIQQDADIIQSLGQKQSEDVMVMVKAWEPPLLEFRDWLGQLRQVIKGSIIILLVDLDHGQPRQIDISTWRLDLQQLGDTGLHVEGLTL